MLRAAGGRWWVGRLVSFVGLFVRFCGGSGSGAVLVVAFCCVSLVCGFVFVCVGVVLLGVAVVRAACLGGFAFCVFVFVFCLCCCFRLVVVSFVCVWYGGECRLGAYGATHRIRVKRADSKGWHAMR